MELIPKEIKKFIGSKNIIASIFRVEANHPVTCGYFCIGFIDFMLASKKLAEYTNLFSPYDFKKNDDIRCFQHDMVYGKIKDLVKRTQSYKVSKDKTFKIAGDPKYDGYQRGLASLVYNIFDKKSASFNKSKGNGIATSLANKSADEPNYQLANELHKPIIKKNKNKIVYSGFKDNI